MDVLALCELLPTYILFSHQMLIHPFVESMTCSLRHIFASSLLGSEENSLAGLCLPEHYVSSVVWRIGRSIRALRSFRGCRVLCALCFRAVLHLGYWHGVDSSCSWCCQLLKNVSPIDLDLKFRGISGILKIL